MEKMVNNYKAILNGWSGLYLAIYGTIAFVIGFFGSAFNSLEDEFSLEMLVLFIFFVLLISAAVCGVISILTPIALGFSQAPKKIRLFVGLPTLLTVVCLLLYYGKDYLNLGSMQSGLFFLLYIGYGLPYALVIFVIPLIILAILDCKHKITPPKNPFKNKFIKIFFISYAIICWIFLCGLFIDCYSFFI